MLHEYYWVAASDRWLVRHALEHFKQFGEVLTTAVVEQELTTDRDALKGKHSEETVEAVRDAWADYSTIELPNRDYWLTVAEGWCQNAAMGDAMREANLLWSDGDNAGAKAVMTEAMSVALVRPSKRVDLGERAFDMLLEAAATSDPENLFPTGIDRLDAILHGGIERQELAVVVATTGLGKSMWLSHIAAQALLVGQSVLIYTAELHKALWTERLIASLTKRSMEDIHEWTKAWRRSDNSDAPDGLVEVREILEQIGLYGPERDREWFIEQVPSRAFSVADIERAIDEHREQGHKVDLLVVDYGDLLAPETKYAQRWEQHEEIYQRLTGVASQRDVCVWTASQATREAEGKRVVSTQHMADAIAKARPASFVAGLGVEQRPAWQGRLYNLHISKTRRSGSSEINILINADLERSCFTEADDVGEDPDHADAEPEA